MQKQVTVIIATYNRPDVLKLAIKSVQNQTFKNWVIYVVGDRCSQSTEEMIKELNDDRIFYYNSPYRFGEQSGPNSIGVALAKTPYIAYLNHDDLWTPDHLEVAISSLENHHKNFYVGRAVMSRLSENSVPIFNMVNPINRKPNWSYYGQFMLYEPCSAWVLKTNLAKKIGHWKRKIHIRRTPPQEYFMEAWRKRAKFFYGTKVTCAYLTHHNNQELHDKEKHTAYGYKGSENEYVYDLFFNRNQEFQKLVQSGKLRPHIFRHFEWKNEKAVETTKWDEFKRNIGLNKYAAYFYYLTGVDIYSKMGKAPEIEEARMRNKMKALKLKTGDDKIEEHNMEEVIADAKEYFPRSS